MSYQPNIPNANDLLSNSQADIKTNFMRLDAVYGVDHYAFSDATPNATKHNQVTLPIITGGVHPIVISGDTKIYGMKLANSPANMPTFSYSSYYDINNATTAVATPLTHLQSLAAPQTLATNTPLPIFDFNGLTVALCIFQFTALNSGTTVNDAMYMVNWSNGVLKTNKISSATSQNTTVTGPGGVLTFNQTAIGNMTQFFWTLQFLRAQV